jgi:hypothetical protein
MTPGEPIGDKRFLVTGSRERLSISEKWHEDRPEGPREE